MTPDRKASRKTEARATCGTCPHRCSLLPGQLGRCRARRNVGGVVTCANYGRVTSCALDPVEKKPLAMWRPGSFVLSVGSYGCNMRCPFCQNHGIAAVGEDGVAWEYVPPEELVGLARRLRAEDPRVTGLAFTYNEPLVGWEYVRDCAALARREGFANVLVSNGLACEPVVREVAGLVDAANIDVKTPSAEAYRDLGGDLETTWATLGILAGTPGCHVEATMLMVPGISASADDVEATARRLAALDRGIPLHLSRFFPCHRMTHAQPTPVADVYRAAEVARRHLSHVFTGNC